MNLEDELRQALQRQEPSPDFTARVLAQVSKPPVRPAPQPWFRWAAVAAAVVLTAGGIEYRHYEGERAKQEVMLAVKIAGKKLAKAQRKVQMLSHRSVS